MSHHISPGMVLGWKTCAILAPTSFFTFMGKLAVLFGKFHIKFLFFFSSLYEKDKGCIEMTSEYKL